MGITNMIATIPGFAGPALVGQLTNNNVRLFYFFKAFNSSRYLKITKSKSGYEKLHFTNNTYCIYLFLSRNFYFV